MNSDPSDDDAGWYEISIRGRLEERWAAWFEGMAIDAGQAGQTIIRGPVVDQAALHGLLARLRDLGIPLVEVRQIPAPSAPDDLR
ncbi:hypothetical protein [Nocardioides bigeumensis]|uniref:hypothetical protein n=1 Tax=Nocardioides bigeumensis TaxID=433657 RepID=UPI0031D6761A